MHSRSHVPNLGKDRSHGPEVVIFFCFSRFAKLSLNSEGAVNTFIQAQPVVEEGLVGIGTLLDGEAGKEDGEPPSSRTVVSPFANVAQATIDTLVLNEVKVGVWASGYWLKKKVKPPPYFFFGGKNPIPEASPVNWGSSSAYGETGGKSLKSIANELIKLPSSENP